MNDIQDRCPHAAQLKAGLEELPTRLRGLPRDARGYPVPWFVAWENGDPEFRAMDQRKWISAVRDRRCWVCGGELGVNKVFVAGPMCGINRNTAEPPCHLDCARWSARNCPFLSNPSMTRREDDTINNDTLRNHSAGIAIARNPGVTMLWNTREFEVYRDDRGRPLIIMGEPTSVEWYTRGGVATRDEVVASIESGLPNLEALAKLQAGAFAALQDAKARFRQYLPLV